MNISRISALLALGVALLGASACNSAVSVDGVGHNAPEQEPEPEGGGCPPGEASCGAGCVDVMTNPDSCGGCSPCVAGAASRVLGCVDGSCEFFCNEGFTDKDGDLEDGARGGGCECRIQRELCDGADNDCDGDIDEGVTNACGGCEPLEQAPGDPCGDPRCAGRGVLACDPDNGDVLLCDGMDLNLCGGCEPLEGRPGDSCGECSVLKCNEEFEFDCVDNRRTYFQDQDGDGVGRSGSEELLCGPIGDFTALVDGDCDDGAQGVNPGAPEICDGVDNDCDEVIDVDDVDFVVERCALSQGVCQGSEAACVGGQILDCDDGVYADHAAQIEATFEAQPELLCDRADNDCDGLADENCCADVGEGIFRVPMPAGRDRQVMPGVGLSADGNAAIVTWITTDNLATGEAPPGSASLSSLMAIRRDGIEVLPEQLLTFENPSFLRVATHAQGSDLILIDEDGDEDEKALMLARLNRNGDLIVASEIAQDIFEPALATRLDGLSVVAWWVPAILCRDLQVRFISPEGVPSETRFLFSCGISEPSVAIGPEGGIVAAQAEIDLGFNNVLKLATFNNALEFNSVRTIDVNGPRFQPSVAVVGSGFAMAFVAEERGVNQLQVLRLDSQGQTQGQIRVLTSGNTPVRDPKLIAFEGSVGLAWVEGSGPQSVRYQRLGADLSDLGPRRTLVSNANLNFLPLSVAVGPLQGDLSRQWFALATASAMTSDVSQTPERVALSFFDPDGQKLCFSE